MDRKKQCAINDNHEYKSPVWIIVFLLLSLIAGLFVCKLIQLNYNAFLPIDETKYTIDNKTLTYNLDSVTADKGYLSIVGWAADTTQSIEVINCAIVLKDEISGVYYKMKTAYQNREGISQALGTDQNIDDCGFMAKTSLDNLNENATYEICILYLHEDNNLLYHTGERVNAKGELISE